MGFNDDAGRKVLQLDGGGGFVYFLATGARAFEEGLVEVGGGDGEKCRDGLAAFGEVVGGRRMKRAGDAI